MSTRDVLGIAIMILILVIGLAFIQQRQMNCYDAGGHWSRHTTAVCVDDQGNEIKP